QRLAPPSENSASAPTRSFGMEVSSSRCTWDTADERSSSAWKEERLNLFTNANAEFTNWVVKAGFLREPFVLVDVGRPGRRESILAPARRLPRRSWIRRHRGGHRSAEETHRPRAEPALPSHRGGECRRGTGVPFQPGKSHRQLDVRAGN